MSIYTRDQLDSLVAQIGKKKVSPVYLVFGERYLCQQAAEKISAALVKDGGNIHTIDGSQEDIAITIGRLSSFSLFSGRQVYRINDTRLFHSAKNAQALWKKALSAFRENNRILACSYLKAMLEAAGLNPDDPDNDPGTLPNARWKKMFGFAKPQENLDWTEELLKAYSEEADPARKTSAADPAKLFEDTLSSGIPQQNILLLLAEDIDRRKRLFKFISEHFTVLDLSIEGGSSSRAQKSQHLVLGEVLRDILVKYGKTMTPDAAEILFERVGFHPVAVAMETEKLALHAGSRKRIEQDDVESLIGRTRQDALFELTDTIGKRDMEHALLTAERLLENGIHVLAVIATLRNYIHNLLLFRALQDLPEIGYTSSMSPALFQQQCLPRLKNKEQWKQELSGHPYAIYMQFKTASTFSIATLRQWMTLLLQADYRMKGSNIAPDIVLQHLIINMLGNADYTGLKKCHGGLH